MSVLENDQRNELDTKSRKKSPGKGWAFSPFFLRPYLISDQNTPMHLSLSHPISDLNSYSQETNDEKNKSKSHSLRQHKALPCFTKGKNR